jgi:hypothetical protein
MSHLNELSTETGIDKKIISCFAKGVIESMTNDGAVKHFISEDGNDLMLAYIENESKKFADFCTTYHTTPEARECLESFVLGKLA